MAEERKKGFDLAAALGAVSELNTGAEGREKLKYIDLALIHPDPDNFYSLDGVEELAGNIELIGLQQPLRVRPDLEHEGEYIIVSGHRRRAAIELLVKEGKFGLVPCLIEGHQESDAMQKLRLIMANSSTRKLTSADLSKQAEEVERLLYQLKEEGIEFPGRMRDHVAKVCQVHSSKLGRLKVIREMLCKDLKKFWENGDLNESVAYAFCKLAPEAQLLTAQMVRERSPWKKEPKNWYEGDVTYCAEKVKKELKPRKGPKGTCEACDQTEARLSRMSSGQCSYDDHCADGKCCHDCPNLGTCEYACPHLSGEVAKAKAAAKEKLAKEKEKREKENKAECAPKIRLWKRFGEARARAGLTFEEYSRKADVRAFRREKKVGDFEQGKKITPSSGGLPYAGGDGVDEWRIRPLIKAAEALGCSVDYLLCRTDEPGMAKAEKTTANVPNDPTWQTGIPKQSGPYYCRIRFDEGQTMTINLEYSAFNFRWIHPVTGEEVAYEVLGWWPLPDESEDDEDDDEGDMDALWYGKEDDDDYLAEADGVLGAEE